MLHSDDVIAFFRYEIVIRDAKDLRKVPWKYIVVDEGHRIKNMNCRLIRELKTYNTANRLLLTGTPLQNNLSELWSLLNFLLPDIFDDLDQFQRWFDFDGLAVGEEGVDVRILEQQQQEQIVTKLHSVLKPFLLRRLKTDVELSIPPKKELVLYVRTVVVSSLCVFFLFVNVVVIVSMRVCVCVRERE